MSSWTREASCFQVKSDSETSLCEIESEDTFAEAQTTHHRRVGKLADRHDLSMVGCSGGVRQADRQGKKDRPRLEVPPPKFLLLLLRCHLTAPIGNWQVQEKTHYKRMNPNSSSYFWDACFSSWCQL